jgi:RimJ/RimL family protein N-acetyltransferase
MSLTNAPHLHTDRLILRGPEMADFDAFAEFHADPVRAPGFGPVMSRPDAWRWFALSIGHWHIHGYGYFTILDKATRQPVGISGIWNPEGWPEPELGWVVYAPFEGKGIAFEAAARARQWAYADLGMTTLTSNILPSNTRSKALATRLGATYERTYENVSIGTDELWRHPGPEALS